MLPSIFREFDNLFGSTLSDVEFSNYLFDEDENNYLISLDLPGITKEDLKIEVKNNWLIVQAENKVNKHQRKYQKTLLLPKTVNLDLIEADLVNGVLTIKCPKEQNKIKLVKIK